ncbi:MAG: hypothetical protein ACREQ7_04435 [Candidatus Binatia bacterium]
MKRLTIWALLIAGLLPLTACHWRHHRHFNRHHSANGYSASALAQNHGDRFDVKTDSRRS